MPRQRPGLHHLLITSGSQQALTLVAAVLLERTGLGVVEDDPYGKQAADLHSR